jgi:hypothetical protein
MANATKDPELTIIDTLAHYLEGKVQEARREGKPHIEISTVDVQTRIASRCREYWGVTALPATWARMFRVLLNDPERLSNIGVAEALPIGESPRTVRFVLE